MNTLHIKILGCRKSGKTTLMRVITKELERLGISYEIEMCENIVTENLTVRLSRNDLNALNSEFSDKGK